MEAFGTDFHLWKLLVRTFTGRSFRYGLLPVEAFGTDFLPVETFVTYFYLWKLSVRTFTFGSFR